MTTNENAKPGTIPVEQVAATLLPPAIKIDLLVERAAAMAQGGGKQ